MKTTRNLLLKPQTSASHTVCPSSLGFHVGVCHWHGDVVNIDIAVPLRERQGLPPSWRPSWRVFHGRHGGDL